MALLPREIAAAPVRETSVRPSGCINSMKASIFEAAPTISNTKELLELSTARAVAVVRYLAAQGVPERRMAAAGFGEFFPVAEGTSPEALQRNRRIELKLTDR